MTEVTVRFQPTPNPNAGKFVVSGRVLEAGARPRSFFSLDDAQDDPMAAALLRLDGVDSIFMVDDFVTVTKKPSADWHVLIPRVQDLIGEALSE